ncbi:TetR/AcrR family transcriptional regulator [Clostridium sp. JS66]|uniref:TetR/AcrR family transcriptional regulator n=1 Tax=Clostridium sp. JS66 TaxID=3064705 RepID=UPI00298EC9E7|nr:TetR/AcrR family transcriptional regulator [Clostridium sp. JS66]WPC44059.1 TetR/AcrR family transcriptional regulator [Clostridium sp. JS66]
MRKKTFLNLYSDQRTKIIESALKEFAEHDYNAASLNNIIAGLDVTKGSFYRYFEGKNDLYDFLVEYVTSKKFNYINEALNIKFGDFFEQFRCIITSYLKFDLTFPVYGRFLFNAKYFNNVSKSTANLYKMKSLLKKVISEALETGSLNSMFYLEFIYICIIKLAEGLETYISKLNSADGEKVISIRYRMPEFKRFL